MKGGLPRGMCLYEAIWYGLGLSAYFSNEVTAAYIIKDARGQCNRSPATS